MLPSVRKITPLKITPLKIDLRIDIGGRQKHIGTYFPTEHVWRKGQLIRDHVLQIAGNTPGWDLGTLERLRLDYPDFEFLEFSTYEGQHLRTTVLTMDRLGFNKSYHHGAQRFLHRSHWTEL